MKFTSAEGWGHSPVQVGAFGCLGKNPTYRQHSWWPWQEEGSSDRCPPSARTLPSWASARSCRAEPAPASLGPQPCPQGPQPRLPQRSQAPSPAGAALRCWAALRFRLTCSFQDTCCTGCSPAEHLDLTGPFQSQHLLNLATLSSTKVPLLD